MSEPIHILSLGAGVQSSTLALMAAAGEVTPMPKCAIFADTQAEPKAVYTWLDWLEKQLPFPVHRVSKGNLAEVALTIRTKKDGSGQWVKTVIPTYIANPNGTRGIVQRQCTYDYKVMEIIRESKRIAATELKAWRGIRDISTGWKQVAVNDTDALEIIMAKIDALKVSTEGGAKCVWKRIGLTNQCFPSCRPQAEYYLHAGYIYCPVCAKKITL